jgi:hypothetical protein
MPLCSKLNRQKKKVPILWSQYRKLDHWGCGRSGRFISTGGRNNILVENTQSDVSRCCTYRRNSRS